MSTASSSLPPAAPSRRRFVTGPAVGGLASGMGLWRLPAPAASGAAQPLQSLGGTEFDLTIGETPMNFTGARQPRRSTAASRLLIRDQDVRSQELPT